LIWCINGGQEGTASLETAVTQDIRMSVRICTYETRHAPHKRNFDTDIRDHRLPTDRTGRDAQLGERPMLRCGAFLSAVPFDPYYWEILADQDEVIRLTVTLAGHYWIISPGR
jgi:hypothetical protein